MFTEEDLSRNTFLPLISGLRVNLRLVIAGAYVGGLVWGAECIEVNVVYKGVVGGFRASNV